MSVSPIGMAVCIMGYVRIVSIPTVVYVAHSLVGVTARTPGISAVEHHNLAPTEAVLIIMSI